MNNDDALLLDAGLRPHPTTMGLPSLGPLRRLGEILGERIGLKPQRAREIVEYARAQGLRFGDAAVALGDASVQDVMLALSTQFLYPCADTGRPLPSPELALLARPHSAQAEALRALRGRLSRKAAQLPGRRPIALVSPDPGDGKSFLAANLGIAFAQTGLRTLVVDADMRGPRLHELFELRSPRGLSGAMIGCADEQMIQPVPAVPGLHLLACGAMPPNPLELVEREAFAVLMDNLPRHFEQVLVDTPAASCGADALAIADRCGASLLVGRRHHSSMTDLRRLAAELGEGEGRLLGVVFNDF